MDAIAAWREALARGIADALCDRIVSDPGRPVPSKLLRAIGSKRPRSDRTRLTPREQEITRLVACGWTNWNISAALEISHHTTATHIRHAAERMNARNRTHLVATAIRRGEI